MELRFGPNARASRDVDALVNLDFDDAFAAIATKLTMGWEGFTGRLTDRTEITRAGIVPAPQRCKIKLAYLGRPFATLDFELGRAEQTHSNSWNRSRTRGAECFGRRGDLEGTCGALFDRREQSDDGFGRRVWIDVTDEPTGEIADQRVRHRAGGCRVGHRARESPNFEIPLPCKVERVHQRSERIDNGSSIAALQEVRRDGCRCVREFGSCDGEVFAKRHREQESVRSLGVRSTGKRSPCLSKFSACRREVASAPEQDGCGAVLVWPVNEGTVMSV